MRNQKDECATALSQAETATEILNDIIMSDEISTMRQNLRLMTDYYLLETEDSARKKHEVYSTHMVLDNFLTKVEEYRIKDVAVQR